MNRGQKRAQWRTQFRGQGPHTRSSSMKLVAPSGPGLAHVRSSLRRSKPGSVQVTIEELVLRGFDRGSMHGIADGLQRQLSSLLASRGVPEGWGRVSSVSDVRAEAIRVGAGAKDVAIGEQVAQALFDVRGVNNR